MSGLKMFPLLFAACLMGSALSFTALPAATTLLLGGSKCSVQRHSGKLLASSLASPGRRRVRSLGLRTPLRAEAEDVCDLESNACVVEIQSKEHLQMYLDGTALSTQAASDLKKDDDEAQEREVIAAGKTMQQHDVVVAQHEQHAKVITSEYLQRSAGDGTKRKIVVLEVYAQWCRKCLKMSKEVFRACKAYRDDVVFLKFDSKRLPELTKELGVQGMPTFIVYRDGERVDHFHAGSGDELMENIQEFL